MIKILNIGRKFFWITCGTIFSTLGLLGIILPILPVIPFFLLASACFFRGSPELHDKFVKLILKNKFYEKYLKRYVTSENEKNIKLVFVAFVLVSSSFSFFIVAKTEVAKLGVLIVALGVILYIYTLKLVKST